jgi:hypothetical protein
VSGSLEVACQQQVLEDARFQHIMVEYKFPAGLISGVELYGYNNRQGGIEKMRLRLEMVPIKCYTADAVVCWTISY